MTELYIGYLAAMKKHFSNESAAEKTELISVYETWGFRKRKTKPSPVGAGGITVMRKKTESNFLPPEQTTAAIKKSTAVFMKKADKPAPIRYSTEGELFARERACRAILAAYTLR